MATYACGDLHGFMEIYKKIKSMLKPEDKVIFLGDAGDRGPESWECIKAIYEDPQFIYLKGNHEDMLVRAAKDYLKYDTTGNRELYSGDTYHYVEFDVHSTSITRLVFFKRRMSDMIDADIPEIIASDHRPHTAIIKSINIKPIT